MSDADRHRAKMAHRKAVQDAEVAAKTITERGLLLVNTGPGKGKSTAAFGQALRMLGAGGRVGVVQFIKGAWQTGERDVFRIFGDRVRWHSMGEGFTWETQDRERDVAAAELARHGLLDILSSDYVPGSLLLAAFDLPERVPGITLPQAIATVTANPARATGLDDRGVIAPGQRADLVHVTLAGGVPVVRQVWRQGRRVA